MQDPYEVLGVSKSASAKDIKAAYRKLAKKHHPDQNPNDAKAKDRFSALNQAYEIVGDEKNRGAFDRGEIDADGKQRFQGFEGAPGGDPFAGFRPGAQGPRGQRFEFRSSNIGGDPFGGNTDIFNEIFGQAFSQRPGAGGGRRAPAGADVNGTLDVSIEEAATAAKVTAQFPDGRKISVKLPAYVEDGQTIRLKGQGEQGPGEPGDALVKIHFRRHPRYRVEGPRPACRPAGAARRCRARRQARRRDADRQGGGQRAALVELGQGARLKGRGLPEKAGGHGDLYAHVRVMLPEHGDPDLEALMKRSRA